jgi:tRNA G18 (ribose-2'-O)-methylase SpoU
MEMRAQQDNRNICDFYKYWRHEAILADQDKNRCELVIAAENFANDFNVSTVVRSSNAFLCKKVYIIGNRKWDRRGAVGMHHYEHVEHVQGISDVVNLHPDYNIVALDNVPEAKNIYEYEWKEKTILVLGQESLGVTQEALKSSNDVVYIPQHGAVRSLNVGSAASIAMAFYRSKLGK